MENAIDRGEPEETLRLLGQLKRLGFDENAFRKLHHWRWADRYRGGRRCPNWLIAFETYCSDSIKNFRSNGNNQLVYQRLEYVRSRYQQEQSLPDRSFEELAEEAFQEIPPI